MYNRINKTIHLRTRNRGRTISTIALFSAYFPPHLGGVEAFTHNLASQLASMGHQTVVVTSSIDNSPAVETLNGGVQVFRIPTVHLYQDRFPIPKSIPPIKELEKVLATFTFDAVVINTRIYPLSLLGARFAEKHGIVPIIIEHGSGHLVSSNSMACKLFASYEHALMHMVKKSPARFYGVSNAAAKWLGHFGVKADGVIHNAIDSEAFLSQSSKRDFRSEYGIAPKVPLVSFTGRLIKEKGVWHLLKCAQVMKDERIDVCFLIAGEGPDYKELASEAPDNFILLGRISPADVSALLQLSDVFCFPSYYPEGLPTSLLEAAVCNNFLICGNVGGVDELITNHAEGTIINELSADSLCDAICDYILTRNQCERASTCVKQRVIDNFNWSKTAQETLDACQI